MENDIVLFSMYAGFMMIVIAPVFKLFSKANAKGYISLIPGYNFIKANSFLQRDVSYLSGVTVIAFLVFLFLGNFIGINPEDPGQLVFSILLICLVIYSLFSFYLFPMLSTSVFFFLGYFGALYGQFNQLFLLLAVVLFIIGLAQSILDFFNWKTLLKGMKMNLLLILLPFISTVIAMVFAAITLISSLMLSLTPAEQPGKIPSSIQYDMRILLAFFVPALFIGIVFVYYLGYSTKTKFELKKN